MFVFFASASRRLTTIIELKCLNFCSHLLYNVYQSCESEYTKFTNLNGFHVLPLERYEALMQKQVV